MMEKCMRNLNYPNIEKIQGFIACMALEFEEMQPLSVKYFILIYSACEETILSISDH